MLYVNQLSKDAQLYVWDKVSKLLLSEGMSTSDAIIGANNAIDSKIDDLPFNKEEIERIKRYK